jgi:cytochrome c-type biogenesis protein CcmH/NrfG
MAEAHARLGAVLVQMGRAEEAAQAYATAARLDPGDRRYRGDLAALQRRLRRGPGAP